MMLFCQGSTSPICTVIHYSSTSLGRRAVLTVVLQRFSEDTVILAELMHLKEPPMSMQSESAMDYVRRAVWGMLYADDACIVSRSP
ncbi:unnamed protein product [Ascophyllum nodosum]